MRWRTSAAVALLAVPCFAAAPVAAQVNEQLSGTIESLEGTTMTLRMSSPPRRPTLGGTHVQPERPTLVVDLDEVPASQWVFLRPGERISVVGVPSPSGRFAAIAVIGGAGPPREPQAP